LKRGHIDKEADMNEDFATKAWADNHAVMSEGIGRGISAFLKSLKGLHDKQFDAPWRHRLCQDECPSR
jgi:hypothetical protein